MIDQALEVIASTKTATIATLNADGFPYATPITYTFENNTFTWKSAPDAVHSENISRDGRVSLSVIESAEGKARGLYIYSQVATIGETTFVEKWQTSLTKYSIELGQEDTERSTPGRFYFKGTNA